MKTRKAAVKDLELRLKPHIPDAHFNCGCKLCQHYKNKKGK